MSTFIKRLIRKVFARHSNPWSAWTRFFSAPLVLVPVWNRSWRQGALLGVWLIANPVVFPNPRTTRRGRRGRCSERRCGSPGILWIGRWR